VYPGGGDADGFPSQWKRRGASALRQSGAPTEAVLAATWAEAAHATAGQVCVYPNPNPNLSPNPGRCVLYCCAASCCFAAADPVAWWFRRKG